ncbi:MAG: YkgJ family cysteine cluster protein [Methanoregula sp.]
MVIVSLIPIPSRITALNEEKNALCAYPQNCLAGILKNIGFHCTCCAKCCTRAFNGHVFLLDREVEKARKIDLAALEPAPGPEFCDQNGTFYVSGYALRVKNDPDGSCWFLESGRCRIYDQRFAICRIYPYMLHREPDETGKIDWRQISGYEQHGNYNTAIPDEECQSAARETMDYEHAFLDHQIAFLGFMNDYFAKNGLRHVQKIYDTRVRQYRNGTPVTVMVYHYDRLEQHTIEKIPYFP